MTTPLATASNEGRPVTATSPRPRPRFGGVLWRLVRRTNAASLPLAGRRWNPIFAVVKHHGRRSDRAYATTVAARRIADGFVISLAFGAQVDWYRNLVAAGGAVIRWRGVDYQVSGPETMDAIRGRAAFHPIQRLLLGLSGIDGYVRLLDIARGDAPR